MNKILLIFGLLTQTTAFALTENIKRVEDLEFIYSNKETELTSEDQKYTNLKRNLKLNEKSENILLLKKQLNSSGQYQFEENNVYDLQLESFIKEQQQRFNLNPNGIIDAKTWHFVYEQPVAWQLQEIQKAKESWNNILLKDQSSVNSKMIVVNIPSMTLTLYEIQEDRTYKAIMSSNVVVGKTSTKTPIKDFNITALKYNPDWTPTRNILNRSVYKGGSIDKEWIRSHNISVYSNGSRVSLSDIENYDRNSLRFVQPSGNDNALGELKFETDSTQNIYLHDTNERNLFQRNMRLYSSGCIRVEKYLDLAHYISNQSTDDLRVKLDTKKTKIEKVDSIPVYIDTSQIQLINNEIVFLPKVY